MSDVGMRCGALAVATLLMGTGQVRAEVIGEVTVQATAMKGVDTDSAGPTTVAPHIPPAFPNQANVSATFGGVGGFANGFTDGRVEANATATSAPSSEQGSNFPTDTSFPAQSGSAETVFVSGPLSGPFVVNFNVPGASLGIQDISEIQITDDFTSGIGILAEIFDIDTGDVLETYATDWLLSGNRVDGFVFTATNEGPAGSTFLVPIVDYDPNLNPNAAFVFADFASLDLSFPFTGTNSNVALRYTATAFATSPFVEVLVDPGEFVVLDFGVSGGFSDPITLTSIDPLQVDPPDPPGPSPVPEPTSLALWALLGVGTVAARVRRRSRANGSLAA
jgi:MYXO-CTERM domain-containing protein